MVRSLREEAPQLTMEERLANHEEESQRLSTRLRESVTRREELVARYEATRSDFDQWLNFSGPLTVTISSNGFPSSLRQTERLEAST